MTQCKVSIANGDMSPAWRYTDVIFEVAGSLSGRPRQDRLSFNLESLNRMLYLLPTSAAFIIFLDGFHRARYIISSSVCIRISGTSGIRRKRGSTACSPRNAGDLFVCKDMTVWCMDAGMLAPTLCICYCYCERRVEVSVTETWYTKSTCSCMSGNGAVVWMPDLLCVVLRKCCGDWIAKREGHAGGIVKCEKVVRNIQREGRLFAHRFGMRRRRVRGSEWLDSLEIIGWNLTVVKLRRPDANALL